MTVLNYLWLNGAGLNYYGAQFACTDTKRQALSTNQNINLSKLIPSLSAPTNHSKHAKAMTVNWIWKTMTNNEYEKQWQLNEYEKQWQLNEYEKQWQLNEYEDISTMRFQTKYFLTSFDKV